MTATYLAHHRARRSERTARRRHPRRRRGRRPGAAELGPASDRHEPVHGQPDRHRAQTRRRLMRGRNTREDATWNFHPKQADFRAGPARPHRRSSEAAPISTTARSPAARSRSTRHGHPAYFKSLGQMDRERGKAMRGRHDLPHLFDDQADHLGRADDALRARLFPAQRSGAPLRAGMARSARLGVGRRRRDADREAQTAGQHARHALPHGRPHLWRGAGGARRARQPAIPSTRCMPRSACAAATARRCKHS